MSEYYQLPMDHPATVQFLLDHNQRQSEIFRGPDATGERRVYRINHPTEIAALKCMDGRLNLSVMTEVEPGIIQPFRNIGGKFDIGWPYFGAVFQGWVDYSNSRGRKCLVLVTYHFSKGSEHRGCAGHSYDTAAAHACANELRNQIERVFGDRHTVVYPIVVGIETDEDGLILHGEKEMIDLASMPNLTGEEELWHRIAQLYPDMDTRMVSDLMPLLRGNLRHIAKIRAMKRPLSDAEHREHILAVGRGFDWLHLPNKALIIGPYSYNMDAPIATAGKLLLGNLRDGRINAKEGIVILSSAVYRDEAGFERPRAVEKATSLARLTLDTLREKVPELDNIHTLVGIVNENTRLFTPIPYEHTT